MMRNKRLANPFLMLFWITVLCAPAMADSLGFSDSSSITPFNVLRCCDALSFDDLSIGPGGRILVGTVFGECHACSIDFTTGHLLGSTADTWVFDGGGSIRVGGDDTGVVVFPSPPVSDCSTIGLGPYLLGG